MERSHKEYEVEFSRRAALCKKALDAGIEFKTMQEWWKELSPLTQDERDVVKGAVRHIFNKAVISGP